MEISLWNIIYQLIQTSPLRLHLFSQMWILWLYQFAKMALGSKRQTQVVVPIWRFNTSSMENVTGHILVFLRLMLKTWHWAWIWTSHDSNLSHWCLGGGGCSFYQQKHGKVWKICLWTLKDLWARALRFTCHGEENLSLPVLLSHRCCQVTHVHAAVTARDVGQEDAARLDLQLHLSVQAVVPSRGAIEQVSGQKATETRWWSLSNLQHHQHSVRFLFN